MLSLATVLDKEPSILVKVVLAVRAILRRR